MGAAEERLDGKHVLSTSDPHLTPAEAALAISYKNLLKAERGFHDLKPACCCGPTTSPDPYWRPADSAPDYTPDNEEPNSASHPRQCPIRVTTTAEPG